MNQSVANAVAFADVPFRVIRELAAAIRLPAWLAYLLRVSGAAILTLYLAFWLEIPSPFSAVTTVMIVANPVRGAIVSKSFWRIVGTAIGAFVAVVQFALFAQSALLYELFLAFWIALCCGLSTLLRFFPSYAAVLAGYTVVIVDVGAIANPDQSVLTALFRLSVVVLGIVVTGLVFLLTQSGPDTTTFERSMAGVLGRVATLIGDALTDDDLEGLRTRRHSIALQLASLEQAIVYAQADRLSVRRRSTALRTAGTRMLGALTGGIHAAKVVRRRDDVRRICAQALAAVARDVGTDTRAVHEALNAAMDELASLRPHCGDLDMLAAVEQARDALLRLSRALADLAREKPVDAIAAAHDLRKPKLRSFLDVRAAIRNALRGGLVVVLASLFWYFTYAPNGATLLAYLVPAAALVSTTPNPALGSVRFAQGTALATILAVICNTMVLPQTTGFPLAIGALMLFAAPGIAIQLNPKWGSAAFAYLVFLNTQINLTNPMVYDLTNTLSNAEMYLLGVVALVGTFRILLPPDPLAGARAMALSLSAAASRLATVRKLPHPITWENVQLQKITILGQRLEAAGSSRRNELVDEACAGLILGRIVIQLRILAQGRTLDGADRRAVRAGLVVLRRLRRKPQLRAVELAAQAAAVNIAAGRRGRGNEVGTVTIDDDRFRAAAFLHEASRLLDRYAYFFDRDISIERVR